MFQDGPIVIVNLDGFPFVVIGSYFSVCVSQLLDSLKLCTQRGLTVSWSTMWKYENGLQAFPEAASMLYDAKTSIYRTRLGFF